MTITFEDLETKSLEGQLLLAAAVLLYGDMNISTVDEMLIELVDVHELMMFNHDCDDLIDDILNQ